MCSPSDMGWLTGPTTTVTPLVLGATAVLFEGVADYPSADRMWKMIERHKITHIGMPPTVRPMLAQAGSSWVEPFDLDSLRIIASTGEPWTENAWRWVHRNVGRGRVPIINWAGAPRWAEESSPAIQSCRRLRVVSLVQRWVRPPCRR